VVALDVCFGTCFDFEFKLVVAGVGSLFLCLFVMGVLLLFVMFVALFGLSVIVLF